MNSRDALHVTFVQASALGIRCEQARDPAVTGAGCSDLRDARRSFPLRAGCKTARGRLAWGALYPRTSSPINCAGSLMGAGGFFVPSREDRTPDPAVMPRSGVAAPVDIVAVPVCTLTSFAKEIGR